MYIILDRIAYIVYYAIVIPNIVPITEARSRLGDLASQISGSQYVLLTKGGKPKVALVDIKYLNLLQKQVRNIYSKTYVDPALLPYTREFSDKEITEWEEEDQL